MSGPGRIWAYEINYPISKVHGEKRWVPWEPKPITLQMREGFFGRKTRQIPQVFHEYIRRDPAVLAALPEVQALIAGAFEAAAKLALPEERGSQVDPTEFAAGCRHNGLRLNAAIRAMTPADAIAARDAMIAEAAAKEREACAELAASSTVPSQTAMRLSAAIRKRGEGWAWADNV